MTAPPPAVSIRAIAASTHGRYLVDAPASAGPWPMLVGFHGYAENAEIQLDRLRAIPGSDRWLLVSVQALHPFYRGRANDVVVAGWMTRQDRELAIADNVAYVRAVAESAAREWATDGTVVYAGFSQGASMAYRAAAGWRAAGVVALGGDVPPELDRGALAGIPAALVGRGAADAWYADDTWRRDLARLEAAGVRARPFEFDAPHAWTGAFGAAVAAFLGDLR